MSDGMSEYMQQLACAVREKNFKRADEALSLIAARCGHERAISRGRYQARHEPTIKLAVPNVVTIHDLPSREGVEIVADDRNETRHWRPAA